MPGRLEGRSGLLGRKLENIFVGWRPRSVYFVEWKHMIVVGRFPPANQYSRRGDGRPLLWTPKLTSE